MEQQHHHLFQGLDGGGDLQAVPLGAGVAPLSAGQQQLPAQMFTTAAQLLDLTDSKGDLYFFSLL